MVGKRNRVLFVLPVLSGGGAEGVMVTLMHHLDRSRFEPHIALVDNAGPLLTDLPHDIPLHDLKAGRARYAIPPFVRLAWKLRPDVVFSTLGYMNLVIIIAKPLLPRNAKLLVREGTSLSAQLAEDIRRPRAWGWLYRRLYRYADKIICQSDYMLDDLAAHFAVPRLKMVRIYNPVDIDRITSLADSTGSPYIGPGPHLVAAGRLSSEKGFDMLLDAMTSIQRSLPSTRLTILGNGPLEAALKEQRERLGLTKAVDFAGYCSNPYPYFKFADILLMSSRYEGLPNVVLEALALGTPVIAMDCPGGLQEIATHTDALRLTKCGDSAHLAEAVLSRLQCLKSHSDRRVSSAFLERFQVRNVVKEYAAVLDASGMPC